MGPVTSVSGANDPDEKTRYVVWFSPCCCAVMDEVDTTCPVCKEPCEASPSDPDDE